MRQNLRKPKLFPYGTDFTQIFSKIFMSFMEHNICPLLVVHAQKERGDAQELGAPSLAMFE